MELLSLSLLGGFGLTTAAGGPVEVGLTKAKALLSYIVLQAGTEQSREQLAAMLWEDSAEAQARLSLRQALVALRRASPALIAILKTDSRTVCVAADALVVDVLRFERLAESTDAGSLRQAVALYRGDFLEGLDARAPQFEDWLTAERTRLRLLALYAMSRLLDHVLNEGVLDEAMRLALRILAVDPLRESEHRALMRIFVRQGQHASALKQYRKCRGILHRELGVGPESETDELYREVQRARSKPDVPVQATNNSAAPPVRDARSSATSDQPASVAEPASREHASATVVGDSMPFVGREREQRQLSAACEHSMEDQAGQAFLLRGEAGIGKCRLVRRLVAIAERRGFVTYESPVLEFGAAASDEPLGVLARRLLSLPPGVAPDEVAACPIEQPTERAALHDLLGLPQPPETRSLYEAMEPDTRARTCQDLLGKLIVAASKTAPVLIVVEDIHWASAELMDALARITIVVNDCATLLIMTSRIEGEPLDPRWRGAMLHASLTTTDLGPLRTREASSLAERFVQLDEQIQRRCVSRSGGNPLFLEQLLRAGAEHDGIPDSIQSVIRWRLSRLAPKDRQAAQAADSALELARKLDSIRFEANNLFMRGLGLAMRGDREEGLRWVSHAYARCEEGGALSFNGAWILAGWALLETDPARCGELLRQGEQILASGSVSHSHFHFYELGIECALETCNFDQAEEYADALARYVAREPLPYTQLVIDRAHALCAWGRGVRSREVRGKLKTQLERARSTGLMVAVPRLSEALEDRKI